MLVVQEMQETPSSPHVFFSHATVNINCLIIFLLCLSIFLPPSSVSIPAFTMGRHPVRCRGRSPAPHSESDSTHLIVKKTVTKEKSSNWGWTRASQTSSVSSVTEPARSASPVRVARYRESEHHRHRSSSRHHYRRHRSGHEHSHHHSHPRALDHHADEHRHRRHHRRRYSEDAPLSPPLPPRVEAKEVAHKSCHCEAKPSPAVKSPHICPSPILVAVPIKQPSRKMEEVGGFTYEEWCKRRACVPVPTETIAPKSSVSNRSTQTQARTHSEVSDQDNNYRYVAMREPGPQDAVVSLVASEIFCAVH